MKETDKGFIIKETIRYHYPIESTEYKFYGQNSKGRHTRYKKGSYDPISCVPYKTRKRAVNGMIALRHKAHTSAYFSEFEIVDLSDVSI